MPVTMNLLKKNSSNTELLKKRLARVKATGDVRQGRENQVNLGINKGLMFEIRRKINHIAAWEMIE